MATEIQHDYGVVSNSATNSVTWPVTPTAGNLLIAFITGQAYFGSQPTWSGWASNRYRAATAGTYPAIFGGVYSKTATGSETTESLTLSTACDWFMVLVECDASIIDTYYAGSPNLTTSTSVSGIQRLQANAFNSGANSAVRGGVVCYGVPNNLSVTPFNYFNNTWASTATFGPTNNIEQHQDSNISMLMGVLQEPFQVASSNNIKYAQVSGSTVRYIGLGATYTGPPVSSGIPILNLRTQAGY